MSKNSQILEAVGGLEAAQGIVGGGVTVGAEYWCIKHDLYAKFTLGVLQYNHKTYSWTNANDLPANDLIKLSDLRTAITEQREFALGLAPDAAYVKSGFKVGDRVVFTIGCGILNNRIHTVSKINDDVVRLASSSLGIRIEFETSVKNIKPATTAEIAAGHHITTPAESKIKAIGADVPKIIYTNENLLLIENNEALKSSRNFWRVMCFAVFLGYGVAWWFV